MYSEEETELRDLIMQNLENCGFLNKLKAEIRAGVFLALEEDGNLKNKIPLFNQKLEDFINTSDGKLIISLIREFLEYFGLNFTLSVFDPEVTASLPSISRSELCDQVNLKAAEVEGPIIANLLKEVIGTRAQNSSNKSSDNLNSTPEKSISNENMSEKDILKDLFNHKNSDQNKEKSFISTFEKDFTIQNFKDNFEMPGNIPKADTESSKNADKVVSDIFNEKSDQIKNNDNDSNIFKETNDVLSSDHDPFFDEPLPSEKTSFFTFSDPLKDKPENKFTSGTKKDLDDTKKSSLSSLKDLPSLTANHEWTFSRDPKNTLPSLDSLKSVSSSEASNEEVINLDAKEVFEKKDSDVVESNEESSEKQISEESIEEELDESSAGFDDLLASSLSLADDVTTDQTVSQVSVVEGIDHVEPCK